jgi:SAM-dependent methyltransferase
MSARRRDCPLCGARGCRPLFTRADHAYLVVREPLTYYRCAQCDVRFLDPETPLAPDVYLAEKAMERPDWVGARRYVHWDDDIARALYAAVGGGRLLDFGSGYGELLAAASSVGFDAEGLDVSAVFAADARARTGRPVFVGTVHDAGYEEERFRAINAHFVFELVHDLRATFAALVRTLARGGVLRVFGPSASSLPARARGSAWWPFTPTRPFVLSDRTVQFLAARHGLVVERVALGGEQSLRHFLDERRDEAPSLTHVAADAARFALQRAPLGPFSLHPFRAYYLRK